MYCDVCETRKEATIPRICTKCAKFMCLECENHHSHVFGSNQEHADHRVTDIQKMFNYFDEECLENSSANQNVEADSSCENCGDGTCRRCTDNFRQRYKNEKIMRYAPQIHDALAGCQQMLFAKENHLRKLVEELSINENQLQQEIKRTEESIHKTTNELLFKVAATLRRREAHLQKACIAAFLENLQYSRGARENAEAFLQVITRARDVVDELRDFGGVPLNKDTFAYLGTINKIDASFIRKKKFLKNRVMAPKFNKPSDKELSKLCENILRTSTAGDLHQTFQEDGRFPGGVNEQADADDELTVGETDDDFGTFHVTGNPQQVSRWQSRVTYQNRISAPQQSRVISHKPSKPSTDVGTRLTHIVKPVPKPRGTRDDTLHGKHLSKSSDDIQSLQQTELHQMGASHNHASSFQRQQRPQRPQPLESQKKSATRTSKNLRFVDEQTPRAASRSDRDVTEYNFGMDRQWPESRKTTIKSKSHYDVHNSPSPAKFHTTHHKRVGDLQATRTGDLRETEQEAMQDKRFFSPNNRVERLQATPNQQGPQPSTDPTTYVTMPNTHSPLLVQPRRSRPALRSHTTSSERFHTSDEGRKGALYFSDLHQNYTEPHEKSDGRRVFHIHGTKRAMDASKTRRKSFPLHLGPNKSHISPRKEKLVDPNLKSTPL